MSRYESRNNVLGDLVWGALAGAAAIWAAEQVDRYVVQEIPQPETAANIAPRAAHRMGTPAQYGIGAALGALYGALYRRTPIIGSGHGLLYGTAMLTLEAERLGALVGAGTRPQPHPWQSYVRGAIGHGVFGVVTDTLLRLFRRG